MFIKPCKIIKESIRFVSIKRNLHGGTISEFKSVESARFRIIIFGGNRWSERNTLSGLLIHGNFFVESAREEGNRKKTGRRIKITVHLPS